MHTDSELTDDEATDLVIREIRMHLEEGRKNFALRAPQRLAVYLLSGLLQSSGLSMVALERLMSEQEISGIRSSHDGRVLRRYMSGETRMTWPTYRRMIFLAIANNWFRMWVARDLFFRTLQLEAAQITARQLIRRLKKGQPPESLPRELIAASFFQTFEQQRHEDLLVAKRAVERSSESRELAHSLGLEI
ncbi:hypothetical protein HW090_10825 [Pseudomonas sp. ABC1]|uniref:hypothetical protein n=1 Tax=Pseudomonas sp. ABC1 TaxID=2748080 RepID=UPI0015C2F565|nr:hypothetical protein [Pseudomonas sp. ABC1]QLF93660.1 hypothetical protein HW090_10825 [Pseudomonas sp. ABC1]